MLHATFRLMPSAASACWSAGDAGASPAARRPPPAAHAAAPRRRIAPAPPRRRSAPSRAAGSLDDRVQDLKADVIRSTATCWCWKRSCCSRPTRRWRVFVSMDVGKLFELDSVQIKLDDKVVTNYLYTPLEVQALHRGGVQRVYVGNLSAGEHEIVAFFTGKGPHDRDYKRGTTIKFDKGTEPKYIELRIKDSQQKLQPEFDVKVWQ